MQSHCDEVPPECLSPNPFQIRRFASQTKPSQECHPERSEGSLSGERSFAALRMTKPDGLVFASVRPHVLRESFDRSLELIQAATSEFKGPGQVTAFDSRENVPIGLKS